MKLAIVIPAYKERFFAETLESLARQTDGRFTIYIGDDGSPQDLQPIATRFKDRLNINYRRFDDNIGPQRLVMHWRRCVELLKDEDWIWFFSDDDVAATNCVETFFRVKSRTDGDVYRFNTKTIDHQGRSLGSTQTSPDHESSASMAWNLLLGRRGNSMPDHIFSRDIYLKKRGFVYTDYAQAADWATSILFSEDKGMYMLQDARIEWRQSGDNISSQVRRFRAKSIPGHYQFIEWTLHHFASLNDDNPERSITYADLQAAALENLHTTILFRYRGLPPALYLKHISFLRQHFQMTLHTATREIFRLQIARFRHDRYERLNARRAIGL